MASPVVTVTIEGDPDVAPQTIANKLMGAGQDSNSVLPRLVNYLSGLASGSANGKVTVQVGSAATTAGTSSGTITITHANLDADDTVTIGGVTFTAKASGATGNQFNIGADATEDAAALAAAINASTSFSAFEGTISAAADTGVVTVSYTRSDGAVESVTLATSDATAFALSPAVGLNVTASRAVAYATGTVRMIHAGLSDGDTLTIGGVAITARAAATLNNEFTIGANATADATALAAAINASTSFQGVITATSSGAHVYLTCSVGGHVGSLITLATSDATAFDVSGSRLSLTVTSVQTPVALSRGVA